MVIDTKWVNGWAQRLNSGTITADQPNKRVQITSPSGGTYIDLTIPNEAGMVIELELEARVTSGESGFIGYDVADNSLFSVNSYLVDGVYIYNKEWLPIKIKIVVPGNKPQKYGRLAFGVKSGIIANVEYRNLYVRTSRAKHQREIIACGLISKASGQQPIISNAYSSFGVKSVSNLDVNTIQIEVDDTFVFTHRPHIFAIGTPEDAYVVKAGKFDATTNTFWIKFTDGAAFVDMSAKSTFVYFEAWI